MSLAIVILSMTDGSARPAGYLATNIGVLGAAAEQDQLFEVDAPLRQDRWEAIVIDHLGMPAGDAGSVDRIHRSWGYQGLGYHFLIGNGNGLADGIVHVGYRWSDQLPGAHTVGEHSEYYNNRAIGICLIGNGDRRPFTRQQIAQLGRLVQRLQRELQIPSDRVLLHRDVASETTSPGQFFASGEFEQYLVDGTR